MYLVPGQGQTTLCGQNSDVNRKASSLCPLVASFKNSDVNRKALSLCPLVASFKKNIFELLILYAFFNVCPHVYSPGAGADNPLWTKF